MKEAAVPKLSKKKAGALLAAAAALLSALGGLVYFHEFRYARARGYEELKAVADLKSSEISDWRRRLAADAKMKSSGISMPFVLRWLASPGDQALKKEVLGRLRYLSLEEGYADIAVVSAGGRLLLSLELPPGGLEPEERALVRAAVSSGTARAGEFYRCRVCGRLHLDAASPIPGPAGAPAAALLLRSDPAATLFPLMRKQLFFDPSADVELLGREGDSAVLINGPRGAPEAAMRTLIPLKAAGSAEAAAVLGAAGMFEGKDYKGAAVLADLRPVPGTPWAMVTRVDKTAILSEAVRHGYFIATAVLLGILSAAGLILFVFNYRQRRLYQRLWLTEKERGEAMEELRLRAGLLDNANDAIHALDEDLRLVYVNDKLLRLTGYSRGELIGEKISKLDRSAGSSGPDRLAGLEQKGFARFESAHTRKDGSSYPVEVYITRTSLGGRKIFMAVASDITERRRSEEALKESEAQFKLLLDNAPEGIFIHTAGKFVYANKALASILGVPGPEELSGKDLMDIVAPESREVVRGRVRAQEETGFPAPLKEIKFLTAAGARVDVENTAIFLRFRGQPSHLVFTRDITARKRMEGELRESLERFGQLAAQSRTGSWETDAAGRYTYASPVFQELTGYSSAELLKFHFYDIHPEEGRERFKLAALELFSRKEEFKDLPNPLLRKDGSVIWVSTNGIPSLDEAGRLAGYRGADTDITVRRKAEEALKESEAQFRLLVDNAPEGIFIQSEGRVEYMNQACAAMLGAADPAEFAGTEFMGFVMPEYREAVRKRIREQLETGQAASPMELAYTRRDGSPLEVESTAVPIPFRGKASHLVFIRDIGDRKRAERSLHESEERFRSLFEKAPLGYQSLDGEGRFLDINQAWLDTFGCAREEVIGRWFGDFLAPEFVEAFKARFPVFMAEGKIHSEFEMLRKDGGRRYIAFEGRIAKTPDGAFQRTHCILQDVTEKRAAEEKLKASLAEKEVLLKEIHHRVKNNLQVVSSLLNMQARRVADPGALEAFRESRARIRAMALVHEVLYKSPDLSGINMSGYFGELVKSLFEAYDASGRVSLSSDICGGVLEADAAVSLGLIANELISNSLKHAFAGGRAGRLAVSLARGEGGYRLAVEDDGPGLPPGLDLHKSQTLGLQLVATLARQLSGKVRVLPGPGARFELRFPG